MKRTIRILLIWINILLGGGIFMSYLANFISPAHFWSAAFFGLVYPVLLIANIGFIIFWLWRKDMLVLISVFAILAGWANIGRYLQFKFFENSEYDNNAIKVLSYNVRLFNHYNWEEGVAVRDSILDYITKQDEGIVCFQEFLTREDRPTLNLANINTRLGKLPYQQVNITYHGSKYSNYGIATYSKYPIINKGVIDFPESYNSCIYSDIVVNSDTLRIYNVHFESLRLRKNNYRFVDSLMLNFNSKRISEVKEISGRLKHAYMKRAYQVDEVSRHIRQSPYSVIVCGDFNDTPVSYTYQKIRNNLKDAFMGSGKGTGNTYRGNFPSFRIDFIFHSENLKSYNYRTHKVNLSDHYPVSCELVFE